MNIELDYQEEQRDKIRQDGADNSTITESQVCCYNKQQLFIKLELYWYLIAWWIPNVTWKIQIYH